MADFDFGDFAAPSPSSAARASLPELPPLTAQDDVFGVRSAPPMPTRFASDDDADMAVVSALSLISAGLDRITGVVTAVHTALGLTAGASLGPASSLPQAYRREASLRLSVVDEQLTRGLVRLDALPKTHGTNKLRKDEVRRANSLAEGVEVARAVLSSLADSPTAQAPAAAVIRAPAPALTRPLARPPLAAAPIAPPASAPGGLGMDDDFGDFSAPAASQPRLTAAKAAVDDDFGDFSESTISAPAAAAVRQASFGAFSSMPPPKAAGMGSGMVSSQPSQLTSQPQQTSVSDAFSPMESSLWELGARPAVPQAPAMPVAAAAASAPPHAPRASTAAVDDDFGDFSESSARQPQHGTKVADDGFGDFSTPTTSAPTFAPNTAPAAAAASLAQPSFDDVATARRILATITAAARDMRVGMTTQSAASAAAAPGLADAVSRRLAASAVLRQALQQVVALAGPPHSPESHRQLAQPISDCLTALREVGLSVSSAGIGPSPDGLSNGPQALLRQLSAMAA